ncbi:DUF501 domain-containing protein [Arthrobacter sp. H14]|uniref:DUF501 domain-containing protein n=1 Tax=Arthrobacter sp. H14 TaxID=1312959 RepID=UPI0004BA1A51|nr:DUF501 domain-containing protein [Arthrobacter sp. H14]
MRVGAIDCGTNSIRLLIADVESGGGDVASNGGVGSNVGNVDGGSRLTDVVRLMRVVRLGQGVDATGRLAEEALERTFTAVEEYAGLMREHGVEQIRFVATSATRDAENRQVFLMTEMSERLLRDEELAAAYQAAHEHYLAVRDEIGERTGVGPVPEIAGVSAGGMPVRVKCLHVLVGHSLAAGPGINPLGDEALEQIRPWWTVDRCYCAGAWDEAGPVPAKDLSRHVKTQEQKPATVGMPNTNQEGH